MVGFYTASPPLDLLADTIAPHGDRSGPTPSMANRGTASRSLRLTGKDAAGYAMEHSF